MKRIHAFLAVFLVISAMTVFGQGSLSPSGPPAPSMKSLQDVWNRLDGFSVSNKFAGYAFVSTGSAGAKVGTNITIAAGKTVKLESITVSTYSDPNCIAYARWLVKEGSSTSRIMSQQIPLSATYSDPVANTRSGTFQFPMWIRGGNVSDVNVGEVHTFSVYIQSSAGNTVSGAWVLTGYYATP